jgi:hypothetical protein
MRHKWSPVGEKKQKCLNCKMKHVAKPNKNGGYTSYYDGEIYNPRNGTPPCKPKNQIDPAKVSWADKLCAKKAAAAKRRPSATARR